MPTQISGVDGVLGRAGEVFDWAGSTPPSYALECPKVPTNVSRTTYAALFAAIGTTWGAGDGSTTFGIPYFPADYAAVNANGNVGTATTGEVKAHTHSGVVTAIPNAGANYLGAGTPFAPTSGSTASTGGSANLAAGMRIMKCVRIK